MKSMIRILVIFMVTTYAVDAGAAGIKQNENAATGTGMAHSRVAIVDEPSAVYYNPAAMTRLKGSGFSLGVSLLRLTGDFTADAGIPVGSPTPQLDAGESTSMDMPLQFPPHLYGVHQIPESNLAVGLGIYSPYASATQWPDDWAGRNFGTRSRLYALAFNPVVAWEVTPELSIAAGFSIMQSVFEFRQVIRPVVGDPTQDIPVRLAGDGTTWGGNVAVLWDPVENLSVGVSFRASARATMTGDAVFERPDPVFAEQFPDQEMETSFKFPELLNAGVGFYPRDDLKLNAEIEFARSNAFQEQIIELETGRPTDALVREANWSNTTAFRLGADYMASSRFNFRGGLAWDPTPVPITSLSPTMPDSNRIVGGLGSTYYWRGHEVALGLGYQHFLARTIRQDQIDERGANDLPGTFDLELLVASLTWTYFLP